MPPLAFNSLSILIRPMPLVAFTQTQHHWHLLPRRTTVIHYTIIIYFFVSLSCRGASKSYHCSTHIMTSPNCLPTSQERAKFFLYLFGNMVHLHTYKNLTCWIVLLHRSCIDLVESCDSWVRL